MKRTIVVKLTVLEDKAQALAALQNQFSAACNRVAAVALAEKE